MKLLWSFALFPLAAFAVTVEPLPQSEFADTEVSTNIAFVVERPAMTRIEFTVALDATPTNNVEVAIGTNEIPPTGYFASEYYKGPKTHDYPNAGYLHIPDAENFVMTDWAGRDVAYTNWFAGTLTWKVPIGWRRILRGYENLLAAREVDHARLRDEYSRPLLIGSREDAYTQTFEIEADGTSSIRKFGYKLERSRWLPFGFVSQAGDD